MRIPDETPPQYVSAHAHDALAGHLRLAALDLDVRVVGRRVFVSGLVNTEEQRRIAGDVVARELPDYELHNEVAIVECAEATDRETERLS